MLPFVRGEVAAVHGDDFTIGWELFGRRALRRGDWKIVWLFEPYGPGRWELFDLGGDPTESRDLAAPSRRSSPSSCTRGTRTRRRTASSCRRATWATRSKAPLRRDRPLARVARQLRRRRRPALLAARPDQPRERRGSSSSPGSTARTTCARSRPRTIQCTPIVVDGVMYLTTPGLQGGRARGGDRDASSGSSIRFRARARAARTAASRTGATARERRLFMAPARTCTRSTPRPAGRSRASARRARRPARGPRPRRRSRSPSRATSPGDRLRGPADPRLDGRRGAGPPAPGHVRAFDVRTGERRWIFHTIPHPGEPGYETWPPDAWKTAGGANAWGGLTLDARARARLLRHGLADLRPLGRRPRRREPLRQLGRRARREDRRARLALPDGPPRPLGLRPARAAGARRASSATAGGSTRSRRPPRSGHLFLLDRETGKPLFPVEERPVPRSDLPGEASWPTQPFPVAAARLRAQRFTEAEVTDLSPESHAAVLARLRGMRTGDVFLPPGRKPSVVLPQFNGGAEWGGSAFDPDERSAVRQREQRGRVDLDGARAAAGEMTLHEIGQLLYQSTCTGCHGSTDSSQVGRHPRRLARDAARAALARGDREDDRLRPRPDAGLLDAEAARAASTVGLLAR